MSLTAQQLAARRIGSSDASVALRLVTGDAEWNPWQDAYAWFAKRTGILEDEQTLPMEQGDHDEPLVGRRFSREHSVEMIRPRMVHSDHDIDRIVCDLVNLNGGRCRLVDFGEDFGVGPDPMTATPDFLVESEGQLVPVETKSVNDFVRDQWGDSGSDSADDVPRYYFVQVQHQMVCLGVDHGFIAVNIGKADFRWFRLALNEQFAEVLPKACAELWRHVQENDPPMPESLASQRLAWPQSERETVEADDEMAQWLDRMAEQQAIAKAAQEKADAFKVLIQGQMRTAEAVVREGKTRATWKTGKRGRTFRLSR